MAIKFFDEMEDMGYELTLESYTVLITELLKVDEVEKALFYLSILTKKKITPV